MLNKIKSHFEENEEGYAILLAISVVIVPLVMVHVRGYCDNIWH